MSAATLYDAERPVRVDFRSRSADRAVVFVHGFLGRADTTWGDFPQLILGESRLDGWDVFGVGYNSSLRADISGIATNNADLEMLGYYLRTILAHAPLDEYAHVALIAHSMGGLIAQQALIDERTRRRISHLFLFGTPSGGARKASFARRLHAQARDMSAGSAFITSLRQRWDEFLPTSGVELRIIAAERDAFVPPQSSLAPFPESVRYVVPGTHGSIVKPKGAESLSYQIVLNALLGREPMMGRVTTTATRTFFFTNIEGSTERWERHPAEMSQSVQRHDAILREAIRENRGTAFKTLGDRFFSVFDTPANAVRAAVVAQLALEQERFEEVGGVHVRMAIHSGDAEQRQGDYFGPTVNRTARLLSIGHGGQIIASAAVFERANAELPPQYAWRDLGIHRMKDLVDPESVFQIVFPGLREEFPPMRSLGILPNNLPNQLSPLVGRNTLVAEVAELVKAHPLATLVGTGGIGKTRIALQVGIDLLDGSGDGVWFVDLTPATDLDGIARAIATPLGVRQQSDLPLLDTLLQHLQRKRLLLILDNAEHVIEAASKITASIRQACPDVSILATSREPLRVTGEHVARIPSLAVPNDPRSVTLESALDYGAIALFVQAASSDDPTFRLTDETAPIVAEICRRLDGIALAIELAAVRVRVLTPRRLAERLDDRFRVLTGGSRGTAPRQQTLHALIDWSHSLLSEEEQRLFRRLGVFVGGWTVEAAEAVCADEMLDRLDIVGLLLSLVEKSLVVAEATETPRFRFLESLRAFALERLAAGGESEALALRHAQWAASLGDRLVASWTQSGAPAEDFEAALEDVRAAIAWALSHNHSALAARTIIGFAPVYRRRVGHLEFIRRIEAALEGLDENEDPRLASLAWRVYSSALSGSRKVESARRASVLAERCDDPVPLTFSLVELAFGQYHVGALTQAQAAIARAMNTLTERNVPRMCHPLVINMAGVIANGLGEYEQARDFYAQALSIAAEESLDDEPRAILSNMAENEFRLGNPIRARELVTKVETISRAGNQRLTLVGALQNRTVYRLALRDTTGARDDAHEALVMAAAGAFAFHITILVQHLAAISALNGDVARAARLAGYADAWYRANEMEREYTEQYTCDLLIAILSEKLSKAEIEDLIADGAKLSQEEATAQALTVD